MLRIESSYKRNIDYDTNLQLHPVPHSRTSNAATSLLTDLTGVPVRADHTAAATVHRTRAAIVTGKRRIGALSTAAPSRPAIHREDAVGRATAETVS